MGAAASLWLSWHTTADQPEDPAKHHHPQLNVLCKKRMPHLTPNTKDFTEEAGAQSRHLRQQSFVVQLWPLLDRFSDSRMGRILFRGHTFCASLRSRNGHGHFTRASLCGNLQEMCRTPCPNTSIKHWAITLTVRTPQSGHTVWGKLGKKDDPQINHWNWE